MFSSALKVLALAAVALALPATESTNATAVSEVGAAVEVPELPDSIQDLLLCTGAYPLGCIGLPTNNGVCINIPASHINARGARVPYSTLCTFYTAANCPSSLPYMVSLSEGIYDLTQLFLNAQGRLVRFAPRRSYLCRPSAPV